MTKAVTKISDIKPLLARGREDPASAFPEIRKLAASDEWPAREVAATALVEIGKRHPEAVAKQARKWAADSNPNIRRAASEGLRGIVKQSPEMVWPVLEILRADDNLYVKKSVANILRNASNRFPDQVFAICRKWAKSKSRDTQWIVKDGLRKLRATRPAEVELILERA
jgi:3-methyladenine DNA glycosylase AlkC